MFNKLKNSISDIENQRRIPLLQNRGNNDRQDQITPSPGIELNQADSSPYGFRKSQQDVSGSGNDDARLKKRQERKDAAKELLRNKADFNLV